MPEENLPIQPKDAPSSEKKPEISLNNKLPQGVYIHFHSFLLGILIMAIATLIAGIYYTGNKNAYNNYGPNNYERSDEDFVDDFYDDEYYEDDLTPRPTKPRLVSTDTFSNYPFILDNEIFFDNKQITDTNNTIKKYVYSEDKQTFAYITNKEPAANSKDDDGGIASAYILKLNQTPKKIYEQKVVYEGEDTNDIDDIAFSRDGERLALTANKNLFVYDSSGNPVDVYEFLEKEDSGVFSYSEPIFSPDYSKLIITRGYYEGSNNVLVDLKTKKMTDLKYNSYTSGKYVIDWLSDNNLLVNEYGFDHDDDNDVNKLHIVSPQNLQGKSYPIDKSVRLALSHENKVYLLTTDVDDDKDGFDLVEFNLENGKSTTIAVLKSDDEYFFPSNMTYSKKNNMIFVDNSEDYTEPPGYIYRLNLLEANPKFILWKDNGSLKNNYIE